MAKKTKNPPQGDGNKFQKPRNTKATFSRLLGYLGKSKVMLVFVFIFVAFSSLAGIIGTAKTWGEVEEANFNRYAYTYQTGVNEETNEPILVTVYFEDANLEGAAHYPTSGEFKGQKFTLKALTEKDADGNDVRVRKAQIEADWGVTDKTTFVKALAVILEPVFPVLQLLFQGKILTLIGYDKETYEAVTTYEITSDENGNLVSTPVLDETHTGEEIGNGYVELMGVKGYEEVLVPILDAVGGITEFGVYDATTNPGGIMSVADFEAITTADFKMVFFIIRLSLSYLKRVQYSVILNKGRLQR